MAEGVNMQIKYKLPKTSNFVICGEGLGALSSLIICLVIQYKHTVKHIYNEAPGTGDFPLL